MDDQDPPEIDEEVDQEEMDISDEKVQKAPKDPTSFLDKEAEESGEDDEEGDDEDDEGDDDKELNEYEEDGFLVLDADEVPVETKKGRRGGDEEVIPLEEEDLELIRGAREALRKKPVKRLKRKGAAAEEEAVAESGEEEEELLEEEDEEEEVGGSGRRKKKVGRPGGDAGGGDAGAEARGEGEEDDDGFIVGAKRGRSGRGEFSGVAGRVTDQQLQEWQAIFGDDRGMEAFAPDADYNPDDDDGMARPMDSQLHELFQEPQQQQQEQARPQSLAAIFDPSVLEKQYLTKDDLKIRAQDVPERFQTRFPNRPPPEGRELTLEVGWILKQCFLEKRTLNESEQMDVTSKIFNVLHFLRNDLLEIPFIVQYRTDYVHPLTEDECWDIYEWDEKWNRLSVKKKQLLFLYGDMNDIVSRGGDERYVSLISQAETEEEANDLADYFHFYFPERKAASDAGAGGAAAAAGARRPGQRDAFQDALRDGLLEASSFFAITAAQFGENMWNNQLVHAPVDDPRFPEELAADFVSERIPTADGVLQGCRELLARQLGNDPYVRQTLRTIYFDRAMVSTFPTEKGMEEITYWHPFRNVKRIDMQPISDFRRSEKFALILEAEKAGCIRVEIEVEDHVDEMLELYQSKGFDRTSAVWNAQRKAILLEALGRHLHPRMKKEFREKLEEWAFEAIAREAGGRLYDVLFRAPFVPQPATIYEEEMPYRGPRGKSVLSICVPDDPSESPYAAVVNRTGEVLDWAKISFFEQRGPTNVASSESRRQALQREDAEKVRKLILEYRPGLIVLGACPGAFQSRLAFAALADRDGRPGPVLQPILQQLESTAPRIVPRVVWVDGRPAQVFRNTETARQEYSEYAAPLRQAISVGRASLDPLSELARLWDSKNSISFVSFHPQQYLVPRKLLLERFERAFVRATCKTGVDVNALAKLPHKAEVLQFVSGLGPRKAKHLLSTIVSSGKSVSRRTGDLRELLVSEESDIVYTNAIAFLRITPEHFNHEIVPLDNTRIHPSDYRFAYKIAQDALEVDLNEGGNKRGRRGGGGGGGGEDDPDSDKNNLVRRAMDPTERDEVIRVDVEALADVWRENYNEEKLRVLQALKEEMLDPFRDMRDRFKELSGKDVFFIVSGETEDSLRPGKLVKTVVRSVRKTGVGVVVEDHLAGNIRREDLSDREVRSVDEIVQVGMLISCRILGVDFERWELQLTSRSSELQDTDRWEPINAVENDNPYLRWKAVEKERIMQAKEKFEQEERQKKARMRQGVSTMRVVDHPSFRNFTKEQVEEALKDAPCGEAIFRPSTKGMEFLTLSFKGVGEQVVHVAIAEKDKPNEMSLGRKLQVSGINEDYDDLDEVIARYVNPIAALMTALAQHRRFCVGSEIDVERVVKDEKRGNPSVISYRVGIDEANPGWFKIFYVPHESIHHEVISLRPSGYRLRSRTFPTLRDLFDWFKRHWNEREKSSSGNKSSSSKSGRRR